MRVEVKCFFSFILNLGKLLSLLGLFDLDPLVLSHFLECLRLALLAGIFLSSKFFCDFSC